MTKKKRNRLIIALLCLGLGTGVAVISFRQAARQAAGRAAENPKERAKRAVFERQIMEELTDRMIANRQDISCNVVNLHKESDRRYTGLAYLSDGTSMEVELVINEDGRATWKLL